ncbi:MAG TPA: hypothetical protein VMT11_04545 [Myxococcaceae bacterium]|nr:hypothetical protein [Myxococcaceae bacterium]
MRRRTLLAAVGLLAGCSLFGEPAPAQGTCARDQDCPYPQRCYVDGCGTLPADLLAEVITSAPTGVTSVDMAVGTPVANLPLVLPDQQLLQLSVRRGAGPYPASVQLLASGQSTLLPGLNRTAQTAGAAAGGVFRVGLSTGRYTVVVSPLDPAVPPALRTGIDVDAGVTALTLDLLAAAQVQTVTGTVLAGPGQPEPVPPQVQLLAPDGRPLSARGSADVAGSFQLTFGAGTLDGGAVLQVTPGPSALGAVATFVVSDPARFAQPFVVGDTAAPVQVSGQLVGPDGDPVSGASVFLQGTVVGGGSGNVGPSFSDADGGFSLRTLPQQAAGTLQLWIIPPPGAISGLLTTPVDVPPGAPVSGTWTCPVRPVLRGALLLPDAGPVVGAVLRADPVFPADDVTPLPPAGVSGLTGQAGTFALRLDPAVYQLEVVPLGRLPALHRLIRVTSSGGELDPVTLPTGRTLTARVVRDAGTLVPQALVRVYRRETLEDGTTRALLLGEDVSDESGVVRILLPQQ